MKTIESIYRFLTLQFKKTPKQTTIKYLCVQSLCSIQSLCSTIANLNSILFTLNQSIVLITTLPNLYKHMKNRFKHMTMMISKRKVNFIT